MVTSLTQRMAWAIGTAIVEKAPSGRADDRVLRDVAEAVIDMLRGSGYEIVKTVEDNEAARPGFDMRSYEVGYIEGGRNAAGHENSH